MDIISLIFSFQLAMLTEAYKTEYSECPVVDYVTCNGLESRDTNYMIYNHPDIQVVRIGLFLDDRINDRLGYFTEFQRLLTNNIFRKSGVNIRIEYAFIQRIDIGSYYENDIRDVYYGLEAWEYAYPFAEFANLPHKHRADFIHLFLDNRVDWNGCGVAKKFSASSQYPVGLTACYSNRDVAAWDPDQKTSTEYIFAHELGHQFGLEHDKPNATNIPLIEEGYGLQVGDTYGTVMSYAKTRVPYYSSNKIQVNGVKYGNKNANAVRALNELAPRLSKNYEINYEERK